MKATITVTINVAAADLNEGNADKQILVPINFDCEVTETTVDILKKIDFTYILERAMLNFTDSN